MKLLIILLTGLLCSCGKNEKGTTPFEAFLKRIPDLELPFSANNHHELRERIEMDTAFGAYNHDSANGIYGKLKINDSIHAVVFLIAGDDVYPGIVTYNATGKKVAELCMVHTPGGSTGYNENGSSYMVMGKDRLITITDTIHHFERDSMDEVIEVSARTEVVKEFYAIDPKGNISKH